MYNCESPIESATEEQIEYLRQMGMRIHQPISRSLASLLITTHRATERQLETLRRLDVEPEHPVSRSEASERISGGIRWHRQFPPTLRQKRFLQLRGKWKEGLTRGEASDLIGEIMDQEG